MKSAWNTPRSPALRFADLLPDLGDDARGADVETGERANVCLRVRGDAAAGLYGLGGVTIFLIMSLVLIAFMAAEAAVRTGGGVALTPCNSFGCVGRHEIFLRLTKNATRAETQTAATATRTAEEGMPKVLEASATLLMVSMDGVPS